MKSKLQACIFAVSLLTAPSCCFAQAQQGSGSKITLSGKFKIVKVVDSKFKEGLEMLGREQDEYARLLTSFALSQIVLKKGNQASLDEGRKLIGLALHLSPRNRDAVIANVQLSKGIIPKSKKKAYNAETLATLLFARAKIQKVQEGESNALLAHCFIQLAADLNPRNEDAIYSAAMMEQDRGALDWSQFTGKK